MTEDCLPQLSSAEDGKLTVLGPALLVREESSCKSVHSYPIVTSITIRNRVILSIPSWRQHHKRPACVNVWHHLWWSLLVDIYLFKICWTSWPIRTSCSAISRVYGILGIGWTPFSLFQSLIFLQIPAISLWFLLSSSILLFWLLLMALLLFSLFWMLDKREKLEGKKSENSITRAPLFPSIPCLLMLSSRWWKLCFFGSVGAGMVCGWSIMGSLNVKFSDIAVLDWATRIKEDAQLAFYYGISLTICWSTFPNLVELVAKSGPKMEHYKAMTSNRSCTGI